MNDKSSIAIKHSHVMFDLEYGIHKKIAKHTDVTIQACIDELVLVNLPLTHGRILELRKQLSR